jgi:hypothetical protein
MEAASRGVANVELVARPTVTLFQLHLAIPPDQDHSGEVVGGDIRLNEGVNP